MERQSGRERDRVGGREREHELWVRKRDVRKYRYRRGSEKYGRLRCVNIKKD